MNVIYYNVDSRKLCDNNGIPVSRVPELSYGEKPVWTLVLLHDDGSGMIPENVSAFKAAVAFDFHTSTPIQCRTLPDKITMQGNKISVPLNAETLSFLEAVSGRESTKAWFELSGLDREANRCFYLIFRINARMVLDPDQDENVPESPVHNYLNASQIYTLLRAGDELQFSVSGEGEGHEVQDIKDCFYRFRNRNAGGDWSSWIRLPEGKEPVSYENATQEYAGLMSAEDKIKLDSLSASSPEMEAVNAESVPVSDPGNLFESGNVEGVLQEIGLTLKGLEIALQGI